MSLQSSTGSLASSSQGRTIGILLCVDPRLPASEMSIERDKSYGEYEEFHSEVSITLQHVA
jgi:hypothetical protein